MCFIRFQIHLKKWLGSNPGYKDIVQFHSGIDIEDVSFDDIEKSELESMTLAMIDAFEKARHINQKDPKLLTGLGVLNFIANKLDRAIELFKLALDLDP